MPETTASTASQSSDQTAHGRSDVGASATASRPAASPRRFTRVDLLRALGVALAIVAAAGIGTGVLLFAGSGLLPATALLYYVLGLCAAAFAAMFTIWLHGRFAAMPSPQQPDFAVTGRLQTLLASAFGVKLAVLVIGVLVLRQFPLQEDGAKFSQVATFAVTFAGASLLCQLATAAALARLLRRRTQSAS